MNADLAIVLALLVAAVVMFGIGRPRSDVVALLMVAALPMTGVIDTADALAGFADPNIVMIALLFVVGEALVRTGIARRAGDWLVDRAGTSETRVLPLLMAIVTTVGSMMSSTGVVALFIPVVTRIARATGIAASRLFMPLSIAALVSGMMTLVATAPNLIVHAELVRSGHEGFGFFSFTPFGVPVLLLAIAYVLVARRWLASAPRDPIAAGLPTEPEDAPPASSRAVPALATLGLMVVLMATGIVPNAQAPRSPACCSACSAASTCPRRIDRSTGRHWC